MKFILPNQQKFKELDNRGIYLYGDIDLNMRVSRYMNIAELLGMMNGNINIPMRMSFSDGLEHGISYNPFDFCFNCVGKRITNKDRAHWKKIKQNRISVKNWFTLCFSEETEERLSFWNAFTKGVNGVFVELKLIDFISAIDTPDFDLYVGKIKYSNGISTHDYTEFAFTKELPYRDEKEVRIYLLPKSGELKWDYESDKSRYEIKFNFNPQMFSKITLSPFIPGEVNKIFLKELFDSNKFSINQLKLSKIH